MELWMDKRAEWDTFNTCNTKNDINIELLLLFSSKVGLVSHYSSLSLVRTSVSLSD